MPYSKEFFDLQVRFARAVARLIGMPLERALLDYTNLYVRFGLGRAFDQGHPTWRQYIDGLSQAADMVDWTYRFYLTRAEDALAKSTTIPFGCFSYVMQDAGCVRIHFHNAEPTTVSPLSIDRLPARLGELCSLLQHVKCNQEDATRVVGTSWLYNLRAYRRCFPEGYVASATVAESKFRNMPLWGQFLDRHGLVRKGTAEDFKHRLSNITNIQDLASSFPVQALAVEAPIALFFSFYGLEGDSRMAALRTDE
ncbi:hypothetical protein [Paraburkholderia terrae]|uniref:Uncharacterized protein n=1 Tax=Paraburkholderia terrae TaxID=311230 RepID=A0ABM7TSV7_9BURK|nr:hypothetical protein [Paraburkholderia terrae]BCZ82173.1 hypothetical protein PTKU64_58480 [Paraburkholderia terrae]BDC38332.1 hypothetical protein PTKU15_16290 [Paraburkholderia terrae]